MAEQAGQDYIFCRKPHPGLVSTATFDEAAIVQDLSETAKAARNCNLEIVMKDVHTLAGQPQRLGRWVELARDVTERLA